MPTIDTQRRVIHNFGSARPLGFDPRQGRLMDDVEGARLTGLPELFSTGQAAAAGISPHRLRRLVEAERIRRLQRGWYQQVVELPDEQRWEGIRREHLRRARLALETHPGHALSHVTAAAARGWPVALYAGQQVHLTALTVQPRSRREADRVLHHSDSIVNDYDIVDGMRVMDAARTVADCLRGLAPAHSVAVADCAIRAVHTELATVREVLNGQHRWSGRPRALKAISLVDPRRESWLESFSFVTLHREGVPLPTPQVEVYDALGNFVGRVDGMWIQHGAVAEADGKGKYLLGRDGRYGPDSEAAALRVVAEGRREQRITRLGLEVVRWDTDEIRQSPADVARRVREAFSYGDISRFRGRLRVDGAWVDLAPFRRPPAT